MTDTADVTAVREALIQGTVTLWICASQSADAGALVTLALERGQPTLLVHAPEDFHDWDRLYLAGGDVIRPPASARHVTALVQRHLAEQEQQFMIARKQKDLETVVDLTQVLASTLDIRAILFTVVSRAAELMRVDRCSIVLAGPDSQTGYVVATSDDATLTDLEIQLSSYPEIREVLRTAKPLVIRAAKTHALLNAVRQKNEVAASYQSLALVPIIHEHKPLGVMFFRDHAANAFDDQQLMLTQTVANATAIALRNARVLQTLKTETIQSTEARVSAEKRMKAFQHYADFFRSAADGMLVTDQHGRVLYANPRASEITGYSSADLAQDALLSPILIPNEARKLKRLYAGFKRGVYPHNIDVRFRHRNGERLTLSVSFSSVLEGENAVLFTFRDVTQERQTAEQLRHTTEFFERVIESSVDAIVSADNTGLVKVFNSAAARIFGYERFQVIDRMNVEALYPPGVARSVMRKIRSRGYGGKDRLEDYRVDMMGSDGTPIAVNISAALIFDEKKPIGTVGVFTDVRDKLRMQQSLSRAQEELRSREKSEAVAQLAGTTAHELNQPLTSILNYADLLSRRVEPGSPAAEATKVLVSEAERMADIVRKIGRITKFETKSYVEGAKILDLERSIESAQRGVNS